MATLSSIEQRKLERLLGMGLGYVLDFSDRTFSLFFEEHTSIDINDAKYRANRSSGSKANRMRGFWTIEPDHIVAKVLLAMIEQCLGGAREIAVFRDGQEVTDITQQHGEFPCARQQLVFPMVSITNPSWTL
ncbi:hypothetical protein [Burkholderia diffusa]|uniref:Uncharacterized protein n=1 Tax=Burkholderia diffusa TaxID=488732 RepID=A0A6P2RB40_9BURK|nr:hypothetical protein [Burkholderia diffusa]VWC29491.1 hypothetical protein BDI24065_06302 [Burkholderia diffusa]